MSEFTKIRLHGQLGEAVGKEWDLLISSVAEAMNAIESLSKRKLFKHLLEEEKRHVRYKVYINEKEVEFDDDYENIEKIAETEVCMEFDNLESIDIVPVLEGADDALNIIMGAALILSVFTVFAGAAFAVKAAIFAAGAALLASGIMAMLAKPPTLDPPKNIELKGATSYLFQGTINTNKEGNPVPIIYGRLPVGSYVLESNYESYNVAAIDNPSNTEQISTINTQLAVLRDAYEITHT